MSNKIEQTRQWIKEVIVGLNLCPFAKIPLEAGQIHIELFEMNNLDEVFKNSLIELNESKHETTVLVSNEKLEYLELLDLVDQLELALEEAGLELQFQLVAFHPDFKFEGPDAKDRANLVNSSPFPIIHILKSESIEKLNLSPNKGEEISHNNEKMLNGLSEDKIAAFYPWIGRN